MDNNNNNTKGRCLYKNHSRYGNIYLNLVAKLINIILEQITKE